MVVLLFIYRNGRKWRSECGGLYITGNTANDDEVVPRKGTAARESFSWWYSLTLYNKSPRTRRRQHQEHPARTGIESERWRWLFTRPADIENEKKRLRSSCFVHPLHYCQRSIVNKSLLYRSVGSGHSFNTACVLCSLPLLLLPTTTYRRESIYATSSRND